MIRTSLILTLSLLLSLCALDAFAQGRGRGGQGRRGGPPPEAVEACEGKSANDACSFTFESRRGTRTLEGTCWAGPDGDKPLACKPSGRPGGRRR